MRNVRTVGVQLPAHLSYEIPAPLFSQEGQCGSAQRGKVCDVYVVTTGEFVRHLLTDLLFFGVRNALVGHEKYFGNLLLSNVSHLGSKLRDG